MITTYLHILHRVIPAMAFVLFGKFSGDLFGAFSDMSCVWHIFCRVFWRIGPGPQLEATQEALRMRVFGARFILGSVQ